MFAIEVQSSFHASHALRLPVGGIEPTHAHTFQVTARLAAQKLDPLETVIDFHVIEKILAQILLPWQNQNLNTLSPFNSQHNPSAERLAQHIGQQLQSALARDPDPAAKNLRLVEIRLTEAPNCLAIWSPD